MVQCYVIFDLFSMDATKTKSLIKMKCIDVDVVPFLCSDDMTSSGILAMTQHGHLAMFIMSVAREMQLVKLSIERVPELAMPSVAREMELVMLSVERVPDDRGS